MVRYAIPLLVLSSSLALAQTLPTERALRYADDSRANAPFSQARQWRTRNEAPFSLTPADSDGGLTLVFRAAKSDDYEAVNDFGDEASPFTINRIILSPALGRLGDASAHARISGKPLKLQTSPTGLPPTITLGARDPKFEHAKLDVVVDLLLDNDLQITGDGNQDFRLSGAIRETKAGTSVTKQGASAISIAGKNNTWTGTTTVKAGTVRIADGASIGTGPLVIEKGAKLAFTDAAEHGGVSSSIEIGENGVLDLHRNAWIIDYGETTPFVFIQTAAQDGRIRSSALLPNEAVVCVEANELGITSHAGRTVDGSSVIVAVARVGDTNLDSKVDVEDLKRVRAAYNKPGTWSDGDINGDGAVNFDDVLKIAQHYDTADSFKADWGQLDQ